MTSIDFQAMLLDAKGRGDAEKTTPLSSITMIDGRKLTNRGMVGLLTIAKRNARLMLPLAEPSSTSPLLSSTSNLSSEADENVQPLDMEFDVDERSLIDVTTPLPLSTYSLGHVPVSGIYYYPNFINATEESYLMNFISSSPNTSWTQLRGRRLQNWGGIPSTEGMTASPLPHIMLPIKKKLHNVGVRFCDANDADKDHEYPNHVLLNEYQAGQGILPHKDGPLYYPFVAILSLGEGAIMEFQESLQSPVSFTVLMQRCSLLIFSERAYSHYFHSVPNVLEDVIGTDLSITVANSAFINVSNSVVRNNDDGTMFLARSSTRMSLTIRRVLYTLNKDCEPFYTEERRAEERRRKAFHLKAVHE